MNYSEKLREEDKNSDFNDNATNFEENQNIIKCLIKPIVSLYKLIIIFIKIFF